MVAISILDIVGGADTSAQGDLVHAKLTEGLRSSG